VRRRDLLAAIAGLPIAASTTGRAQSAERVRRVGYFTTATGAPDELYGVLQTRALVQGLRELGWADGRNITIEHRFSGSGRERIRTNAKELVALKPDVILSVGSQRLAALLAETRTIPIVFTVVADPIASGYVASLARPGGNATGFSTGEAPIAGKWLELLKEIAPQTTRVLVLALADAPAQLVQHDAVAAAAPALGLTLASAFVREMADYEREIGAFAGAPGGSLVVLSNAIANANRERLNGLATRYRLPAVYSYPIYAQSGGLISYGSDPVAQFHDAAGYIDKILRGAKPGDLPVQQPTRFVLAVNVKTAKALGLTVPPSILARADEVIE
jgi:putative tryptophan/tyrosine transport system substrate-binding protein